VNADAAPFRSCWAQPGWNFRTGRESIKRPPLHIASGMAARCENTRDLPCPIAWAGGFACRIRLTCPPRGRGATRSAS